MPLILFWAVTERYIVWEGMWKRYLGRPGQFASQTTWDNVRNPGGTGDLENVAFIAAHDNANGFGSAMAILDDGTLVSWGDNKESKLGIAVYRANNGPLYPGGTTGDTYLTAEPGGSSAFAYRSDGEYCGAGNNIRGAFGNGQNSGQHSSFVCFSLDIESITDEGGPDYQNPTADIDGDGVINRNDLDDDNDGILDVVEDEGATLGEDVIQSSYRASIIRTADGYAIHGEGAEPGTYNSVLKPTPILPEYGYAYSGDILLATLGGYGSYNQFFVLSSDGLWVWGNMMDK